MKNKIRNTLIVLSVVFSTLVKAQHVAVFCGGDMYTDIEQNASTMKLSGFNTVIFWSVHIATNGDLVLNDSKIIANGEFVGKASWPAEVLKLKEQPTSVNRIEFSIGAWGVPDFENIQSLINNDGLGENSILYKNFNKLKEITGADAIDFDDESNYDISSTVEFSKMLIGLGYTITLCPYTRKSFWQSVYNQVRVAYPNSIDRIYLQCYAGGASNTPASWNDLFTGINVSPGLWSTHGTSCNEGLTWRSVKSKLTGWRGGIEGAFMWSFGAMQSCSIGGKPSDYATAIRDVMGIETIAPNKAYNPTPSDFINEVSVDVDLKWIPGSFDAKHKVYFGSDSVLTEGHLMGTFTQSEYEPGTLKNDSTYFWRIDEVNSAGTIKGDLWRFITEKVTTLSEKSTMPNPSNEDNNPSIWSSLNWKAGTGSITHKVYFGTNNPPAYIGEQTDTFYRPKKLLTKTNYFWRVDEVNSAGVTVGDVWSFSIQKGNISPEAQVTVSSEYVDLNWSKEKLIDGIVKINGKGEWASNFETYPWVKLVWNTSRTVNRIVLYDRPHPSVGVRSGTLTFSDGTSIKVGELPNNGDPKEVTFDAKEITWIKFQVDDSPGSTTGLAEFEVFESSFSLDVARPKASKILVYPNPAINGAFYINTFTKDIFQLQIYNSNGEPVKLINHYKNNNLVDISGLPRGFYVLKISNKSNVFVCKILN